MISAIDPDLDLKEPDDGDAMFNDRANMNWCGGSNMIDVFAICGSPD